MPSKHNLLEIRGLSTVGDPDTKLTVFCKGLPRGQKIAVVKITVVDERQGVTTYTRHVKKNGTKVVRAFELDRILTLAKEHGIISSEAYLKLKTTKDGRDFV